MAVTTMNASALLPVYRSMDLDIAGGRGSYLITQDGRELLDFTSGIGVNAFGYGDAQLNDAIQSALTTGLIHTSNLFRTQPAAQLAARLTELSCADKVFFCNSGGEANEGAIKFARRSARSVGTDAKHEIVAIGGSFHGRLMGTLAVTDRPAFRDPFLPVMPGAQYIAAEDIDGIGKVVSAEKTAAIIVEPIQGEGGVRPLSQAFLRALRVAADAANAVLIFDEVQCGYGRTGTLFAYEQTGVEPDIITLAKPLAGGLPMGAILLKQHVANAIQPGDHATTFGGGPFVASVALHVIDRIAKPEFLADVQAKGEQLGNLLGRLMALPTVKQVRGVGLMWGIELDVPAAPILARAIEKGIVVTLAGEKVVRLLPPLIMTVDELEKGIELLREALS